MDLFVRNNGGRVYKIHYLNEVGEMEGFDIPFFMPKPEEQEKFDLPYSIRVFHAIKKQGFKEENEIRAIIYKKEEEKGICIPFDFNKVIEKIFINPTISKEQKEKIRKLSEKYKILDLLEDSTCR